MLGIVEKFCYSARLLWNRVDLGVGTATLN
jgi:hypothetical protein